MDRPKKRVHWTVDIGLSVENGCVSLELSSWKPSQSDAERFLLALSSHTSRDTIDNLQLHLRGHTKVSTEPSFSHLARLVLQPGATGGTPKKWRFLVHYLGRTVFFHGMDVTDTRLLGSPVVLYETREPDFTPEEAFWLFHVWRNGITGSTLGEIVDISTRNYVLEYEVDLEHIDNNGYTARGWGAAHLFHSEDLRYLSLSDASDRLPLPWEDNTGRRLLIASPQVESALHSFSELWMNPSIRTILLLAPPGSGKEECVAFLRSGMRPDKYSEIAAPAMTPNDLESKLAELAGHRGLAFIDEIDKAEALRNYLLRVLEAKTVKTKGDLENIVFVFTGAGAWDDLRTKLAPADFWTRMQQVVQIAHPLMVGGHEQPVVLSQYVRLFVWRWLDDPSVGDDIEKKYGRVARATYEHLRQFDPATGRPRAVDSMTKAISKPLYGLCRARMPSIRHLRSIVQRTLWGIFAAGFAGLGVWERSKTREWSYIQPPFQAGHSSWDLRSSGESGSLEEWCLATLPVLFIEICS